ncbi:MAG TPA: gliding motility-associated C-terminal domain-containing protein, partial [Cytophagaceae bacterium]
EMVITLTDAPTITLAPDITICANQPQASLNATLSKPIGVQWSSAGIGEFSASTQPNTTYKAGASDIKAGQVVLTITTVADGVCLPVFKPVTLKISSGPEVNAGTNQSVCSNSSTINLNGSVTKGSTTGKWTTTAVGGSFNPSADVLTTSYSLPEAFTAASIEFILTSTNNGSCGVEDDTVTFTFSNSTGVDAGKDQELCSNLTSIQLSGVVSGDSPQGLWEGGLGTFSPERGTLNATYRPTEEEIASGSLILTLRSVSTNGCASSSDDVKITFLKIPEALAGSDKSVCANNASLSLEGSVKNATGGIWETSATGGQFMPNSSDLKATYKFTEADTKGSLTFKLTTLGNGNCEAASDEVVYTFTQPAVVNAGDDTTVCTSVNEIALLGTINENINVKWTTSNGTGRFTSESSLATTYIPSAADKAKGGITLTLSTISDGNCTVVSDVLTLNFVPGPTVNAGLNQSICSGKATVSLEGVGSNTSRVEWSTGISSFAQSLKATYQLSSEEQKQTKLAFYLEGLDANGCSARDTVEVAITNGPTINAGLDISMCANKTEVSLNATAPTGLSLLWSAPNGGTFETSETIEDPLYRPSQAEKATGKATLKLSARADDGCTSLDSVDVTFTDSPTVTLGNDLTICANNTSAPLAGTFTVAKGVLWTKTGDGTFSDANSATSTYSPGPNDIKTGRANLTLTTVENGNCDAASDNLEIIINPSPVLTVNADESVCKSIPIINLEGVLEGISQAKWTTNGEGNIAPSATSLNASYTPTAGDVAKGSLNFILTSLDHGLCEAVQDIYTVTFTNNAGVEAGVDQSVCRTNNNVRLIGKISGTNPSGKWRSLGMGEFNRPTEQSLDVQYIPNEADFTAGKVQLILDATDEGCAASSDTVDVTFIPEPTVTIGEDKTVCSNSENVPLNATIVNGEGGIWESSGTGFFGDQLAPNTTFTPSPADIAGGNITLTFTTTDNGNCPSATDDLTMSFILAPTLNAGNDTSICASSPSINLKGTMSAQANITWDSEGTGSFLNRNSLNPTYNLSDADVSAGRVNLILRLSESGSCSASADTIKINYTPAPLVTLGEDMAVCTNSTSIPIMGTLQNAQEGIWSSTGRGTFSNPSAVPTNYSPTADDKAAGSVTMTFTTTGNTSCEASTADITINFTPIPTLEAGEDVSVCSSNASVNLKGTLSSPSDIVWSSNGTGTFSPDNTSLNAIYKVSAADMSMGDITLTLSTKSVEGCEVVSDNLKVSVSNVIGQSPSIVTRSVTKTRDAESSNYINFQVLFPESMQEVLTIRRRSILPSSSDFIDVGTATVNDIKFTDNNLPNHDASYEYVISGKNICGEEIESVAHHTIKLTSVTTEIDTAFIITWNPYTNWPSGVESYEVYINKSGEGTTLYQKVGGGVNQVSYLGTRTSNPPCFIVKAKEKASNPQESWSNSTCVEFPKEGLSLDMIPNAISPNNDGKNDVWDIDNIEKYDNEVTIFNQWDNKVYYKRGYTNDFSGENLPDGQYYYLIKYDDFTQRGTLLIVR